MPVYLRWYVTVGLAAIMMCFFFPGKKNPDYFFTQQMVVSFTHFVEAFCLLSQLYHLHISRALEGLNSGYLMVLGLSRLNRIFFWLSMSSKWKTFWFLIAADVVHTIMVLGFLIQYRYLYKKTANTSVLGMSAKDEIYSR